MFIYIALLKTIEVDQSAAQRMQIKEMNKIITHTVKWMRFTKTENHCTASQGMLNAMENK